MVILYGGVSECEELVGFMGLPIHFGGCKLSRELPLLTLAK